MMQAMLLGYGAVAAKFYGDRGVTGGGDGNVNIMGYYDITSAGNASDFGDLTVGRYDLSPTSDGSRGVFSGGANPSVVNTMDYITVASTGNATDFGDLPTARHGQAQGTISDGTTGIWGGGDSLGGMLNEIVKITIATTGNATDFGDLDSEIDTGSATSNNTRGIFAGGNTDGGVTNKIQYITIDTTGNASDFGDLTHGKQNLSSLAGS